MSKDQKIVKRSKDCQKIKRLSKDNKQMELLNDFRLYILNIDFLNIEFIKMSHTLTKCHIY